MKIIEIKDKEGNLRIKLSRFEKQFDFEPVFIDLSVEITLDRITAEEKITIELSDLDEFVKNLKKLNNTLIQTFYFQHIDEQLQIKFEPKNTGNISVTGFLKDKQYVNTLNFYFETVPTEIPYTIKQSEKILGLMI